jgi:hypothetical protein
MRDKLASCDLAQLNNLQIGSAYLREHPKHLR